MFCDLCKNSIPDKSKFCPYCGNTIHASEPAKNDPKPIVSTFFTQPPVLNDPPAQQSRRGKMPGFWGQAIIGIAVVAFLIGILMLARVLHVNGETKLGSTKLEGSGFSSGEEALMTFVDAMKRCDVDTMVSCFAIESWAEHFRFKDYFSFEDYNPNLVCYDYLPEATEFGKNVNYRIRLYNVCNNAAAPFEAVACGCFDRELVPYGGNGGSMYDSFRVIDRDGNNHTSYDSYLESMQNGDVERTFRSMTFGKPFDITEALIDGYLEQGKENIAEKNQGYISRYIDALGADDLRDYGVSVEVDGFSCYFTVQTVCYEGRWYILYIGSRYANLNNAVGGFCLECPGGN